MTNHSGPILAQRDNLTVTDCKLCGYAHLTEFPSEAALSDYYKSDFWQHTKAGALADFERQAEWWAAVHGDWLECVEAHTRGRRLADVGSGYGLFMRAADSRGWRGNGLEPNEDAAMYSASRLSDKWRVLVSGWHDTVMPKYDCISAHWLIEHLPNPLDFLLWAKSHLSSGGVLLAVIPQEWTEAQARANEIVNKKAWWLDPTHLNYWSQTSFANLLGRAGFRIVDMLASYPMERFITDTSSNYVDNPDVGGACHRVIERIELSQTREQRITEARERARYGRGRDLICICRKD